MKPAWKTNCIFEGRRGMCLHPDILHFVFGAVRDGKMSPEIADGLYRTAYAAQHGEAQGSAADGVHSGKASAQAPAAEPTKIEASPSPEAIRKRRQRANEKTRKAQIEMFSEGVTSAVTGVTSDRDGHTEQRKVPKPLKETTSLRSVEDGGGGNARAEPLVLVTQEAISIADEIIAMVGHDPEFIPPGWCGLAMLVQAWLAHWTRDEIIAGVRAGMAGKRDGPPETPRYFEKPIARVHLRLVTPTSTAAEDSYAQIRASRPAGGWQESRDAFRTARAKLHERVVAFSGSGS